MKEDWMGKLRRKHSELGLWPPPGSTKPPPPAETDLQHQGGEHWPHEDRGHAPNAGGEMGGTERASLPGAVAQPPTPPTNMNP